MIVVMKEVEARLLEDVRQSQRENLTQRCLYMAFSQSGIPKKDLFENFLRLLQEIPDIYNLRVYMCQDKDIFVLMQGFMQREFAGFLHRLVDTLKAEELAGMVRMLEVSADFAELESLCIAKAKAARIAAEEKGQAAASINAEDITQEIIDSLDMKSIATIHSRRRERAAPVVMTVDDDQIARTLVGNVVREDYECLCLPDGRSAIVAYVNSAPDVLFLDIGLPDISGHDVLECIFQIDPDAYVIMFSGRKDKENIMRALEAGALGFVGKPFTREKLYQYISRSPHIRERQKHESGHAVGSA